MENRYFIDDLVKDVPEFLTWSGESVSTYKEMTTQTLGDIGLWLKELAREEGEADLIQRICECINKVAEKQYENDDIHNNICVALFWVLDYSTIEIIKKYLSEPVLALGRNYLKKVDLEKYEQF
jgi:hypothetical protein